MTKQTRILALVAAVLAAGFFLGGTVAAHGLFSAEMASWVQGIGTIAAVVASLIVANNQKMQAERHRLEEQFNRLKAAHSAGNLVYSATIVAQTILGGNWLAIMGLNGDVNAICDIAEHALNALRVSDYDDQEVVTDIHNLKIINAQVRSHTTAMLNDESWWEKSQIDRAIIVREKYADAEPICTRLEGIKFKYQEKLAASA